MKKYLLKMIKKKTNNKMCMYQKNFQVKHPYVFNM